MEDDARAQLEEDRWILQVAMLTPACILFLFGHDAMSGTDADLGSAVVCLAGGLVAACAWCVADRRCRA